MKKIVAEYITTLVLELEKLIPTKQHTTSDEKATFTSASMHKLDVSKEGNLAIWVYLDGKTFQSVVFDDEHSGDCAEVVALEIYNLVKPLIQA